MADDINFQELVERAIDANYDPAVLDEIEDYRPEQARNIVEWITSPRFLGGGRKPFPKQVKILSTFLEEYCPMRFCTDRRFYDNMFDCSLDEIFERVTFMEHGVCPKCGTTKEDLVHDGLFHNYYDLAGCAGQRSSKTTMVAGFLATYQLHRFLCLPSPWRFYRLLPKQKLHMTFVAVTKGQAGETLWDAFRASYDTAPWFQDYNRYLESEQKRLSSIFVKVRDTYIAYVHKALGATYADAHKKKLRGLTRFFGAEDEIGWMDDDQNKAKVVADPDETYEAIERSLLTVRASAQKRRKEGHQNVPDGIHASISSPSRVTDKIMRLVREADEVKRMWAFHNPTWEINPEVSREFLEPEFQKNAIKANRDYGADPPFASTPYIADEQFLLGLCRKEHMCKADVRYYVDGHGYPYVYKELTRMDTDRMIPRCISCDAGETRNHFAVVLTHLSPEGHLVVDQAFDVMPETYNGKRATIHFQLILEKLVFRLLDSYVIEHVIYDRWESTSHIHQIRGYKTQYAPKGIKAEKNSPKFEDAMAFRTDLATMTFPKLECDFSLIRRNYKQVIRVAPTVHMIYQMLSVREVGRSLKKGVNAQDDIFRAVWNAYAWMRGSDNIKTYTDHSGYSLGSRKQRRGVVGILSMGGANTVLHGAHDGKIGGVGLFSAKNSGYTAQSKGQKAVGVSSNVTQVSK